MAFIIDGPNKDFASRVIDGRRKLNLTQEELAELIGVDKRSISTYENGHTFPREETLRRLAGVFGVDAYWLATGNSKEMANFIANQFTQISKESTDLQVELIYIEDWNTLEENNSKIDAITYVESPKYSRQSSDLTRFVPVLQHPLAPHRATRYPGAYPLNSSYPTNTIIIFNSGLTSIDTIPSGSDVIFKMRGNENNVGLRKLIKEPGVEHAILIPTDSQFTIQPLLANDVNTQIIGVVITSIRNH